MKVTRKISTFAFVLGVLCGAFVVPIAFYGLPELVSVYRTQADINVEELLIVLALGGLMIGFLLTLLGLGYVIRHVVLPLRTAAEFANQLAAGEIPQQLPVGERGNDEIHTLMTALNFLRDRQQNLQSKLKLSVSREADIRREIEQHDMLQLRIMIRMLPELRYPLGSIKGLSRILLLELGAETVNREEMRKFLKEIGHRVGTLSRQIERLIDIGQLNRDRWSRSENVEFNTAEFMRELLAFNLLSLREREVTLVNHFSASAPESLLLDRELLQQLMVILIRAVGRSAGAGETVVVSCFREEGKVVFEVRDSRAVPCREWLSKAYLAWEDSGEKNPEKASINMLGLIFVRDIALRLGTALRVLSTENSYTTLRLEVSDNCIVAGRERNAGAWRARSVITAAAPAAQTVSDRPLRVLHGSEVSDAPLILKRLLGAENIDVVSVGSAEEMLELSKNEPFDGFIVSASLKDCDLPDLIERLRRNCERRDVPVAALSHAFTVEMRRRLNELERVFPMNIPVNYALLGRVLREAAIPQSNGRRDE